MAEPKCIYCMKPNTEPSQEHVVAESLGGNLLLCAEAVCKGCNNGVLNDDIDIPIRNALEPILVEHEIVGKSGEAPTMRVTELDAEEGRRKYIVSKKMIESAERRKLLSKETIEGGHEYYFRANSEDEFEKIKAEMKKRYPNATVTIEDVTKRPLELPDEHMFELDFRAPHWSRWAAKTCLNLIAHVWGTGAARAEDFDELRHHAMGKKQDKPAGLQVGGIGADKVYDKDLAPTHEIKLCCKDGQLTATMKTFECCHWKYVCKAPSLDPKDKCITIDARGSRELT